MAISSTSAHLRLMLMLPGSVRRFSRVIKRILGNLDGEVLLTDDSLTGQTGLSFEPPGLVQIILFQLVSFVQRVEALTHDAMTGGAGTHPAAGAFHLDMVLMSQFEDGNAGLGLYYQA